MEDIKVDEVLSRYILDKTHIRYSNRTVKYSAFLPAPDGTTSVFRVSGLTEEQVWEVGDPLHLSQHVAQVLPSPK